MRYSQSNLFRGQVIVQFLLSVIFCFVSISNQSQALFCGLLLCTVGIPHGANDYLYRPDQSLNGLLKFLGNYLGIMVLYVGMWWLAPVLALILFFIISFHHFGQSNFETESLRYPPSWLWGIWILMFPVVLHFEEALHIFSHMLSFGNKQVPFPSSKEYALAITTWQWAMMLGAAILFLASVVQYESKNKFHYMVQFVIVTAWYCITPLLFGFIVVFCLWHSLQSMRHQANYFRVLGNGSQWNFIKAMLPFSIIALVSFALYVYYREFNISEAFILLSLITLPHVLIMHRLYHQTK